MTVLDRSARFFGGTSAPLFGVMHPGRGDTVRDRAVLLCYPAPQEYSMVHWSFRHLATSLADIGFPVLRFDYYATGDSAGGSSEGSLARWVGDIRTAAEELRELSGVRRVSVVGMRLGAALAVRAVAQGLAARELVLWDPVVDGANYVATMQAVEHRVHRARHYPVSDSHPTGELFGYPFSDALRTETTSVNLLAEPLGTPRRMLIVSPGANGSHAALLTRARNEGVDAEQVIVDDPVLYDHKRDPVDTLLAHAAPRAIAAFLGGRSG